MGSGGNSAPNPTAADFKMMRAATAGSAIDEEDYAASAAAAAPRSMAARAGGRLGSRPRRNSGAKYQGIGLVAAYSGGPSAF